MRDREFSFSMRFSLRAGGAEFLPLASLLRALAFFYVYFFALFFMVTSRMKVDCDDITLLFEVEKSRHLRIRIY